jgi:hypothetical protein
VRRLLQLAILPILLATPLVLAPASSARFPRRFVQVAHNPADRMATLPIDDYGYDFARRCRRSPTRGALALQAWLGRHAAGESWGIMRCEKLSRRNYSLHADGRALDWHLDARDPAQSRAARRLIKLLLAPDQLGNPHALARRMGIQEIIWDCAAWWAGSEEIVKYSACYGRRGQRRRHVDATTAHRDHIHFGLNRAGARKLTSFWH